MIPSSTNGASCIQAGGAPPTGPVCPNALPTSGPHARGARDPLREGALGERASNLAHQPEVEVKVVQGREPGSEHVAGEYEMAEGSAAEVPAGVAVASLVDRTRVARVHGIADHQLALSGEQHAVPPVSGRQHAVEQVIAHGGEANQIAGRADAH